MVTISKKKDTFVILGICLGSPGRVIKNQFASKKELGGKANPLFGKPELEVIEVTDKVQKYTVYGDHAYAGSSRILTTIVRIAA